MEEKLVNLNPAVISYPFEHVSSCYFQLYVQPLLEIYSSVSAFLWQFHYFQVYSYQCLSEVVFWKPRVCHVKLRGNICPLHTTQSDSVGLECFNSSDHDLTSV